MRRRAMAVIQALPNDPLVCRARRASRLWTSRRLGVSFSSLWRSVKVSRCASQWLNDECIMYAPSLCPVVLAIEV